MIRKVNEFLGFESMENMEDLPAPESVVVRSKEELYAKLEESEKDVAAGRTFPAEIVFEEIRRKYGFSG